MIKKFFSDRDRFETCLYYLVNNSLIRGDLRKGISIHPYQKITISSIGE